MRGGEGGGAASDKGGQLHVSADLPQCQQQSLLNKEEKVKEPLYAYVRQLFSHTQVV